jgi:hypothetical protein
VGRVQAQTEEVAEEPGQLTELAGCTVRTGHFTDQQCGPDSGAFSSRKRVAVSRFRTQELQVSRTSPLVRKKLKGHQSREGLGQEDVSSAVQMPQWQFSTCARKRFGKRSVRDGPKAQGHAAHANKTIQLIPGSSCRWRS